MIKSGSFGSCSFSAWVREIIPVMVIIGHHDERRVPVADRKDWKKIKTEYITGNISYRDLAKKYDVHFRTISNKARAEGWVELKRKKADETVTKTIDAIEKKQIDRGARLASVAEKLLVKVERLIEEQDILDPKDLKNISGVLKDLKEVQMIKSDTDLREQEARIANLRKQADLDPKNVPTIIVQGLPEEFKA